MPGLRALIAIYAAAVVGAIVIAYPRLVTHAGGQDFRARPARPQAHAPFTGPAAVRATAPTFEYRLSAEHTGIGAEPFHRVADAATWTRRLNAGIHDASKSSPAVDASGVYVGADSSWIYAYELDGSLRWKFRVAGAKRGVHGTAALDEQFAYIGAYNGTLYALRKADGELGWALRLGDTIGSSAVIDGDSLYVAVETFHPADGFVARVRRTTGEVIWLSAWLGEQSHSTPTLDLADRLVIVGSNNGVLRALDLDTGEERWRLATKGAVKDTPCLVDGVAYITAIGGALYAVRARDGSVVWQTQLGGRSRSSPSFVPDLGYLIVGSDDGAVQAIAARDGRVVWRVPTAYTNMIASALVLRDDDRWTAWMACSATALCALSTATGDVVQRLELGAPITNVPTVVASSLYVATNAPGGLMRFVKTTGREDR